MNKPLAIVGVALTILGVGVWYDNMPQASTDYASNRLPKCDSPTATADVQRAVAASPTGQMLAVRVLGIDSVQTVSQSDKTTECHGTALLNSGVSAPVHFTYTIRPNGTQYYLRAFVGDSD